jgi:hypothetical protein
MLGVPVVVLQIDCTAHFPPLSTPLSQAFRSLQGLHVNLHNQGISITSFLLSSLSHLSLRNYRLSEDSVMRAAEQLASLPNLKSLDLGHNGQLEEGMLSQVTIPYSLLLLSLWCRI